MKLVLRYISMILLSFAANAFALEKLTYMTEEYPPYNFKDSSGQATGIAVDLLNATLKNMNAEPAKIDLLPWARGYSDAQKEGFKNVLFSTTRTKEREGLFKWVGPIASTKITLFALKDSGIKVNSKEDLVNYMYSVIRDDVGQILLKSNDVPDAKINPVPQFDAMAKLVASNRTNMFAYESNVAKWLLKSNNMSVGDFTEVYTLKEAQLFYAFNKSVDDATVAEFQKALDAVKTPDFMQQLESKYLH